MSLGANEELGAYYGNPLHTMVPLLSCLLHIMAKPLIQNAYRPAGPRLYRRLRPAFLAGMKDHTANDEEAKNMHRRGEPPSQAL